MYLEVFNPVWHNDMMDNSRITDYRTVDNFSVTSQSTYQLSLPAAVMRCRSWGLTLDAEALLILDDEVLLVVLELAQIVLSVLGQQSKLLKSLVDLLVFLRHAVHHPAHWRARLSITKCDLETGTERHGGNGGFGNSNW